MASGKDSTAKAEKHELLVWDCRLSTFHTLHKEDNQKMALSYNIGYILACGNTLHDEEVKELTAYFQKQESTFRTADVDNFKAAFYEDKPSFEAWLDAAFPLNKDDGAAHKEALRAILYAPEINDFMTGVPWATVSEWIKKQWLMPAVQIWLKIML
eukprot:1808433-Rhodomonas_salina.1